MLRTLTIALRRRRHWDIPAGVTHVLYWVAPEMLAPADRDPAVPGWWEIQTAEAFVSGKPDACAPDEDGPADRTEDDLRGFVNAELGEDAAMTPFEMSFTAADGSERDATAYWLTPAGGGR